MITLEQARILLQEMTNSASLLRHMRSIELVMAAYAKKFNENEEEWAITGLLHDADYEAYPEEHPNIIVTKLREQGDEKIAHAISAHYTKWNVPYTNLLDKALLACDELTGFIIACCQVRPEGVSRVAGVFKENRLGNGLGVVFSFPGGHQIEVEIVTADR